MRSDRDRDAEMDRLLRAVLADGPTTAAGACPPADGLAAYAERTLTDGERQVMDAHLAACRRCQEALALLAAMPEPSTEAPSAAPAPSWWRAGWKRWLVPLGAAATGVVLYVAVKPDATLRPSGPPQESVVASAPARLEASPPRALAEGTSPVASEAPLARKDRPAAPRVEEPSQLVQMQPGKKDETAGRLQASKARPTTIETLPEPVTPPAMARDAAAPVATLVGAVTATAPPPPPSPAQPSTQAKGETSKQVKALPVVGGVVPRKTMDAAAESRADEKPATLAEGLRVTGETPTIPLARAAGTQPILVSAPASPEVRWRFLGARIFKTVDGGRTWHLQHAAEGELLAATSPSRTACWAVGAAGLVLLTADGETWTARPFPEPADLVAVTAADVLHATVTARDGRRFSTEDGGTTWTVIR